MDVSFHQVGEDLYESVFDGYIVHFGIRFDLHDGDGQWFFYVSLKKEFDKGFGNGKPPLAVMTDWSPVIKPGYKPEEVLPIVLECMNLAFKPDNTYGIKAYRKWRENLSADVIFKK